jgi:hypothetical protein
MYAYDTNIFSSFINQTNFFCADALINTIFLFIANFLILLNTKAW